MISEVIYEREKKNQTLPAALLWILVKKEFDIIALLLNDWCFGVAGWNLNHLDCCTILNPDLLKMYEAPHKTLLSAYKIKARVKIKRK